MLTFKSGAASADIILQLTGTAVTNSNQFDALTFTSGLGAGIDVADPNNTFTLGKNASGSDIVFTGAGVFEKLGAGTLVITSALAYTGNTYLGGGTLKIDAQNGGSLSSSSALVFSGGSLYLLGKNSGTTTQTLGGISLSALNNYGFGGGASTITVDGNGGAGTTLALGSLPNSTSAGYTLNIKVLTGGQVSTTTTTTTNGLVGNGRILFTDASNNVNFASIPGTGTRFIQAATYTSGLPASGSTSTVNYSQTDSAAVTASESVNALKLTTSTTGQSLAISSGQTLTLTTGALLFTSANDYSITGGTLVSNTAGNSDLIIHQYGAGALTIGSVIANGLGGSTLTKAGTGTLILSGANTYTGQTYVTGGILSISSESNIGGANGTLTGLTSSTSSATVTSNASSLPISFGVGSTLLGRTVNAISGTAGSYTITLSGNANTAFVGNAGVASWVTAATIALYSGGVLQATADITLQEINSGGTAGTTTGNRGISIGNSGGGFDVTTGNTLTVTGTITAAGMMTKSGAGTLVLGAGNNLFGGLTIIDGTLRQNVANALTNANSSTATSNLIFGNGSAPKLQLNNFDAAFTSLVGSNVNAVVENGSSTAATRTLTISNGADNTYAGILRNGSTGLLALAKSGGGTLTLSNAGNTFTGGITIYNGTLEGTQSGTLGSGTITLADGVLKAAGAFTNAVASLAGISGAAASYLNNAIDTSGGSASFSGVFSGTGALNKTGANTLTLSNASNTYTGSLTASAGTVSFASMGSTAALTLAGGNFTVTGNTTVASLAVNSAGTLTISPTASQFLTLGSLTGSNALTVTGSGSIFSTGLKLTGITNSGFSGTITTNATLFLANENLLGTNANALTMSTGILGDNGSPLTIANHSITLTGGGGITLAGTDATGDMTITGGITGAGGITIRSQTSRAIVLGGTNSYTGTTDIYTDSANNSTLRMAVANALPSGTGKGNLQMSVWSTGTATLDLNGFNQTVNGLISAGSGSGSRIIDNVTAGGSVVLTVGAGNATGNTFAGIIKNTTGTVSLVKIGTGTQTLTGANTYAGGTTVNQGTLTVGTGGTLGASTGALAVNNTNTAAGTATVLNLATAVDTTVGNLSGSIATPSSGTNTATINTQTGRNFTVNQTTAGTYAGTIAGAGSVTLGSLSTDTLTLTGSNTYSGTTTVVSGALQVGSGGAGTTGTGAVTVKTSGTILGSGVVKGSSFTAESGSTIRPGDSAADSSYGTLTFTPVSTGTYAVQSGASVILGIATPTTNDATFGGNTVGSAGYNTWLDGVSGAGGHDRLVFTGAAGSTLTFSGNVGVIGSGYTPHLGDVFNLLDWTGLVSSNFSGFDAGTNYRDGSGDNGSQFDLPDISASGYVWDVSRFTISGNIAVVTIVPEPARLLLLLGGGVWCLMPRRRRSTAFPAASNL